MFKYADALKATIYGCLIGTSVLFSGNVWAQEVGKPAVMERVALCVAGVPRPVRVELAQSEEQRSAGLMGRRELGAYEGMWFKFSEPPPVEVGFYMFRTLIPLDVAFLDQRQRIVAIRTMPPCRSAQPSRCPVYGAGELFFSALEVNAGFFERHGVVEGAKVTVAGPSGCVL